jgi:hypothetical protein
MKDPRQVSNATQYSLKDAVLAAFSGFFMQSESFLDYQRHLESHHGTSNALTARFCRCIDDPFLKGCKLAKSG